VDQTSIPDRAEAEPDRFCVTVFPDAYARTLSTQDVSLTELIQLVLETTATEKSKLPLFKLAKFGTKLTENGSLRHNANVEAITGVELDYDDETISFEDAVATVKQARLKALVYTSPSYTPAKSRWRIVLPTSGDRPPTERARLAARVNGLFGGSLAPCQAKTSWQIPTSSMPPWRSFPTMT
jgi:hypothetical protein